MDDLNNQLNQELKEALSFDGIAAAEKITGVSYKENDSAAWLGMTLTRENSKQRDTLLEMRGDSKFSNKLLDYQKIIEKIGFKKVFELPFVDEDSYQKNTETLFIYFNFTLGILLTFDTFFGMKSVNGSKFYYNWKPFSLDTSHQSTSGGSFNPIPPLTEKTAKWPDDYIWTGNHDGREAIVYNIENLLKHGEFVTPWKCPPFLWLLHFMDTKDKNYDYKKINRERISLLPPEVQERIVVDKTE